ncbi:hypothetical protein [Dongshaea marina]|nr:hypothetical protein [Dongshaea marina]
MKKIIIPIAAVLAIGVAIGSVFMAYKMSQPAPASQLNHSQPHQQD